MLWQFVGKLNNPKALAAAVLAVATGVCGLSGISQAQQPADDNKPLVVFVHSQDCKVCAQVRPVVDEVEKAYKDKAGFARLEVTNEAAKKEARKQAKVLGVSAFLSFYEDTYPAVGVFNSKKKLLKEFYGLTKKDQYTQAIDKAMAGGK